MKRSIIAAAALVATITTVAYAAVTFVPETGTGYVGKGDVQQAYGLNNKDMQTAHTRVSFTYESEDSYSVEMTFETGNPDQPQSLNTQVVTIRKNAVVDGVLDSSSRKTGQWTGWNLNGYKSVTSSGAVPEVGGACPNGNLDCEITAVTPLGSTGGLFAHLDGQSRLLQ